MVLLESMGLVDGFFWAIGRFFNAAIEHPFISLGIVIFFVLCRVLDITPKPKKFDPGDGTRPPSINNF